MTEGTQSMADHAELHNIRRLKQFSDLRHVVDDAARRADAHERLELALRYWTHPPTACADRRPS